MTGSVRSCGFAINFSVAAATGWVKAFGPAAMVSRVFDQVYVKANRVKTTRSSLHFHSRKFSLYPYGHGLLFRWSLGPRPCV